VSRNDSVNGWSVNLGYKMTSVKIKYKSSRDPASRNTLKIGQASPPREESQSHFPTTSRVSSLLRHLIFSTAARVFGYPLQLSCDPPRRGKEHYLPDHSPDILHVQNCMLLSRGNVPFSIGNINVPIIVAVAKSWPARQCRRVSRR
jgi:hypothetical protein